MPTAEEWLAHLEAKLRVQKAHAAKYDRYFSGESQLEIVTRDFRDVFGGMFDAARMNICRIAVEATMERLVVDGFAVGDDDNQAGADEARRIWEANDLDEMSQIGHTELAAKGAVYTLTWPGADHPTISIEDYTEVAVARQSGPPYDVVAALKVWTDEWDGLDRADLYLPDGVVLRYRRNWPLLQTAGIVIPASVTKTLTGWRRDTFDGGVDELPNPYGRPPFVELANRARLLKPPHSDLVDVAPLQDAHDKILADLIIAASFGAVPVRTATGLTFKTDGEGRPVDETGKRVTPFDVRADRVWISPDVDSRFGTLEGSTLEGFVKARDAIIGGFRTVTRIPLHYVDMGGTSGVAGETLKALEGPLVRRVQAIEKRLGSGHRKTLQLALWGGPFDGAPVRTRWADTETRAEAQQGDVFSKLRDGGVPLETCLEQVMGWPRETIRRTLQLAEAEGLLADDALARLQRDIDTLPSGDADLVDDAAVG